MKKKEIRNKMKYSQIYLSTHIYLYIQISFFDNLSDYNEPKSMNIGDTFEKFQNAFNSYISSRKDHELAPEVADIVNKVSDAVNNQKNIEGKKEKISNSDPTNDSKATLENVD